MNKFLYNTTQYTHYRPQYPNDLFKYLRSIVNDNKYVLDCGAGSGQATQGLSKNFKYIIATDISLELLSKAPSLSNVLYVQSVAEKIPVRSQSMDLICIAQALHWFPLNKFYDEMTRILKPKGVITAWCYNQSVIEKNIDFLINKIYLKISGSQNPSCERQYLYEQYQTIPFPFHRINTPNFKIEMHWNLVQLLGYISTWPGLLEYQKRFGVNLLDEVKDDLFLAWGDPLIEKCITWPIYLLMGQLI